MFSELQTAKKVVGVKQSKKAIREGSAQGVILAKDAEARVIRPIRTLCEEMGVPVEEAETMAELGKAAKIDIGAAVVTLLKD